jgi:hypothetical protein
MRRWFGDRCGSVFCSRLSFVSFLVCFAAHLFIVFVLCWCDLPPPRRRGRRGRSVEGAKSRPLRWFRRLKSRGLNQLKVCKKPPHVI